MTSPQWQAVRAYDDRRRVTYWRLTRDPDSRKDSLGAVARVGPDDDCIEGWFRARTYDWETGNPGGIKLGYFPTKLTAMRAVEEAVL